MTESHDVIRDRIRTALADASVSSSLYDTDTLADVLATAVDPTPAPTEASPDPHEVADGTGTTVVNPWPGTPSPAAETLTAADHTEPV